MTKYDINCLIWINGTYEHNIYIISSILYYVIYLQKLKMKWVILSSFSPDELYIIQSQTVSVHNEILFKRSIKVPTWVKHILPMTFHVISKISRAPRNIPPAHRSPGSISQGSASLAVSAKGAGSMIFKNNSLWKEDGLPWWAPLMGLYKFPSLRSCDKFGDLVYWKSEGSF